MAKYSPLTVLLTDNTHARIDRLNEQTGLHPATLISSALQLFELSVNQSEAGKQTIVVMDRRKGGQRPHGRRWHLPELPVP